MKTSEHQIVLRTLRLLNNEIDNKEVELKYSPISKFNSDKYWAKKVSSLNTRNNFKNTSQNEKLDMLGEAKSNTN